MNSGRAAAKRLRWFGSRYGVAAGARPNKQDMDSKRRDAAPPSRPRGEHSLVSARQPIAALLCALLLALLAAGCGGTYLKPVDISGPKAKKRDGATIAVVTMKDVRATNDSASRVLNIPIVVWWGNYRKTAWDLEARASLPDTFKNTFADLLAEKLRESGAFGQVVRVATEEEARKYPFVVRGRILEASMSGKTITYGLGWFRNLAYVIALPKTTRHWDLSMDFDVVDGGEMKPVVGAKKFEVVSGVRSMSNYADLYTTPKLDYAIGNLMSAAASHIVESMPASGSRELAMAIDSHNLYLEKARAIAARANQVPHPVIVIASPRDGQTVREKQTNLDWRVDAAGRVKDARATLNGADLDLTLLRQKITTEQGTSPLAHAETRPIALAFGENKLEIEITDFLNQSSKADLKITRMPKPVPSDGARLALVVGVSNYAGGYAIASSPGAANAKAFAAYLADPFGGQMRPGDVKTLVDDRATKEEILAEVSAMARDAISGDTIIVYFSGLSVALDQRDAKFAHLAASGSSAENVSSTGVSVEDLMNALGNSLAENTILILDAAYPAEGIESHCQGLTTQLARRQRNLALLASTDRASTFWELGSTAPAKGFTGLLLQALNDPAADLDANGVVTLDEATQAAGALANGANLPSPRFTGREQGSLPLKMLE